MFSHSFKSKSGSKSANSFYKSGEIPDKKRGNKQKGPKMIKRLFQDAIDPTDSDNFLQISPVYSKFSQRKSEKQQRHTKKGNSLCSPTMKKPVKVSNPYINLLNTLGKMIKMANRAKKSVFLRTFANLNPKQHQIINDLAHVFKQEESRSKKEGISVKI